MSRLLRDPDGNLTSLRRHSGQSITLGDDTWIASPPAPSPPPPTTPPFGYDLLGRRLSVNLSGYAVRYVRDNAGRLTSTSAGDRTLG